MVAIRSYLFSGCLLLLASGSSSCTSSAEKSAAQSGVPGKGAADSSTAAPANLTDSIFKDGTVYRNSGKDRKAVRLEDGSDLLMSAGTTVILSKAYNRQNRECQVN